MNRENASAKILALDGGGLRAAFSLSIMRKLEEVTKRPIHELFDLIIGTSTGALLAFGIGYNRLSASGCLALYRDIGQKVFPTSIWKRAWGFGRDVVQGAYWDAEILEESIKRIFGPSTSLSDMKDRRPQIACVAAECSHSPGALVVFSTYGRREMPFVGSDDVKVWQAIRASTAAPTFFDVFELRSDNLAKYLHIRRANLLDGGLLANDPALVGFLEGRILFPNRSLTILSIGTGTARTEEPIKNQSWKTSLRVTLNTAMSGEVVDTTLKMLLGENYFRINGDLDRAEEMDDYNYFDYWRHQGEMVAKRYDKWNQLRAALI